MSEASHPLQAGYVTWEFLGCAVRVWDRRVWRQARRDRRQTQHRRTIMKRAARHAARRARRQARKGNMRRHHS
jgi:hypothetical protein